MAAYCSEQNINFLIGLHGVSIMHTLSFFNIFQDDILICLTMIFLFVDFCPSYNVREQRILEQFDCITLFPTVDCPKKQFFSNTILNR